MYVIPVITTVKQDGVSKEMQYSTFLNSQIKQLQGFKAYRAMTQERKRVVEIAPE